MKTQEIRIPEKVEQIIRCLNQAGYEAYVVGGCVRDSLLGRTPGDWDITTSASPGEVKRLFRRTIDTGIAHGTVTVMLGSEGFEVTTYRIDGVYEDGRHPRQVTYTSDLGEDLMRRDFTINAMAYHPETGLVDLFGGCMDLERGLIRCVGKAEDRFTEDALRMMRSVRFSAQLSFEIEKETAAAVRKLSENLNRISAERIQMELVKLLESDNPGKLRDAWSLGITKVILPEFDRCMDTPQNTPHHCYNVGEHILKSMELIRSDRVLRLTMLLHDIAKPVVRRTDEAGRDHFRTHGAVGAEMSEQILRRLKFDNDTIRKVVRLVFWHDYRPEGNPVSVRRAVHRIGEELFPLYLEVQRADMLAQSMYRRSEKEQRLQRTEESYREIQRNRDCVSLKTLAVTGRDLMASGFAPGREMGELLDVLLSHVLEHPKDNEKEILLRIAEETHKQK